jgi:hypothetical protein
MLETIYQFSGGAIAMGELVLGVFFLKFWRRTQDSLFLMFAVAFWLLAANGIAFIAVASADEETDWTFLLRLLAFVLILIAIIRKNMKAKS